MKRLTQEEFIKKSRSTHGDKYDYSKVDYVNQNTKVGIICPEHGEFWQVPKYHMDGNGCPMCGGSTRYTTDTFIERARCVHGDKYDYSKTDYINNKTKVCIICPEHGEFWQRPENHLLGQGCPACGGFKRWSTEIFIEEARRTHGDKYDYTKVKYNNQNTKVCIICPEHGKFLQTPKMHLRGQGCPKCVHNHKITKEEFLLKARQIHGWKYDYSKVDYKNTSTKVCMVCPKHGEFWQTPNLHLKGCGCPECGGTKKKTQEQFIEEVRLLHGDRYDYSHVEYVNDSTKVHIVCPKHGDFFQTPNSHLVGTECPLCAAEQSTSRPEKEICRFITSINPNIKTHDRTVLNGYELDVYDKERNLAFEFDGLYWHNEINKPDRNYHLKKTQMCEDKGVQLIHIFEDEWRDKQEIVKSRIRNLMGYTESKIYARRCEVREIDSHIAGIFLNKNHIQGKIGSQVRLGLYYNEELVAVMTFGGLRKNLGRKQEEDSYELLRFCNRLNTTVVGGANKLFNFFI